MPSATHQQATISSSMPPLHYSAASSPMTCPESFRSPKHTTERFQKILCDNPKSMTAQSTTYNVVDTATQLTPSLLCPKCGVAHASSPDEDSEPGPPQNPRKKFDCDRCDKQFSRQQDARRHMNSIHLKKTYTCDICCRNFSRSDVFKRHLSSSQQHMAGGQRPRQQHHREPRITRRTSRRNANT
ncbi:hypothetical protein BCR43DRAFT_325641 [Syncephalastrum racemosum]|uniref:C2H2-type domain-containing protein n=1 Tax=Syncephalastrum racemosum TaxID=13706 RepID=A0A1X2H7P4_SYNRA|nr:hypothetical protein BCR43DRAFT_325641 [Syncephalastrum racemosum]